MLVVMQHQATAEQVEKVVATMETPNSHQGILPPAKKKERVSCWVSLDAHRPTVSDTAK